MPSAVETAQVEQRLRKVRTRIEAAAERARRDIEHIRIVGITKSHSADYVRAAHQAGLRLIGENRVEEGLPKRAATVELDELEWHMVGHIQSRKAKNVIQTFDYVHSIDRRKIADKLNQEAEASGKKLPVLLECNVSGEATKWGWDLSDENSWQGVVPDIAEIMELQHLEVRGLMTMAPMVVDPEIVRPVFRRLRKLRGYFREALSVELDELSMGMTDDFEVAVEEGATLLRIGRAIFGPRSVR